MAQADKMRIQTMREQGLEAKAIHSRLSANGLEADDAPGNLQTNWSAEERKAGQKLEDQKPHEPLKSRQNKSFSQMSDYLTLNSEEAEQRLVVHWKKTVC